MDEYPPLTVPRFEILVASPDNAADGKHATDKGTASATSRERCPAGKAIAGLDDVGAADAEGLVESGQDTLRAAPDSIFVFFGKFRSFIYLTLSVRCHDDDKEQCYK